MFDGIEFVTSCEYFSEFVIPFLFKFNHFRVADPNCETAYRDFRFVVINLYYSRQKIPTQIEVKLLNTCAPWRSRGCGW